MKTTILRLAMLGAVLSVPAYAQVAPATPNAPARPGAPATSAPATSPGAALPESRSGTTTTNPRAESTPPAATIDSGTRTSDAPVAGANSFTEGQARNRIEAAGFTGVDGLQKDDQGIWRGRAQRNGQQVSVSLDFQGNVSTR